MREETAVLFSCKGGQRAYESAKAGGGHGLFFHFVIEGLQGGAANDKGLVTWNRLVTYVQENVEEQFANLVPMAGVKQEPHEVRNLARSPVLVNRKLAAAGAA